MTDHPDTTAPRGPRLRFTAYTEDPRTGEQSTCRLLADSIETAYRAAQAICDRRRLTLRYVVRTP